MTLDEIADQWIDWAVSEPRVRALWIEAEDVKLLRRPYASLRMHLAAEEPDYPSLLVDLSRSTVKLAIPGLRVASVTDTPRFAKELKLGARDRVFTLIAEQSYLLAKRPRAEVVPLVDKTGHLTHVLDFSARKARG